MFSGRGELSKIWYIYIRNEGEIGVGVVEVVNDWIFDIFFWVWFFLFGYIIEKVVCFGDFFFW